MSGQSRKWMILVATIWLQAFTGTNFDFSSYSSDYKMVLGVSQVQLNYLAVASDMGKALGWSSGLAILHLPLWLVLFMAASMGFVGYGLQWLVMQSFISLPYFVVSTTTTYSISFPNHLLLLSSSSISIPSFYSMGIFIPLGFLLPSLNLICLGHLLLSVFLCCLR